MRKYSEPARKDVRTFYVHATNDTNNKPNPTTQPQGKKQSSKGGRRGKAGEDWQAGHIGSQRSLEESMYRHQASPEPPYTHCSAECKYPEMTLSRMDAQPRLK